MEKPRIVIPLLIISATISMLVLVANKKAPPEQEVVVPVRVQRVSPEPPERTLVISGTTRSADTAMMRFQVGGRVLTKDVRLGDTVEKGDVLATLYNPEVEPIARRARQNLARARAQAEQAQRDFDRIEQLLVQQAVTRQEWERSKTQLTSAEKAVAAADAELLRAEQVSQELELVAAFAGSVTEVLIDVGDVVNIGAPAVRLSNPNRVELSLPVNDRTIGQLSLGQRVAVRSAIQAEPSIVEGTIVELSPFREQGALPEVKVLLPADQIRPGAAVSAELTIAGESGLGLPLRSVLMTGENTVAVYRIDNGVAQLVPIRPLSIQSDYVLVEMGVSPGEQIVTEGIAQLFNGAKVSIIDAAEQENVASDLTSQEPAVELSTNATPEGASGGLE